MLAWCEGWERGGLAKRGVAGLSVVEMKLQMVIGESYSGPLREECATI